MEITIPNILTILRIPLLFAIVLLDPLGVHYADTWIFVLFLISMVSDFLDGYLARKLNQVSQFGKIADPLMDKFFIIGMLMWLLGSGKLGEFHIAIVLLLFLRELTITGMRGSSGLGADWYGKWKTTFLFLAILLILLQYMLVADFSVSLSSGQWIYRAGVVCLWVGCILGIISGIRYMRAWSNSD
jgi:CDP-diacylglycerol--glycerol-3-phosphate 3-phosphatidyltransferase